MAFGTDLLKNSVADRQQYYQEQIKIQDEDQIQDQEKQNPEQNQIKESENKKNSNEENTKTNQINSSLNEEKPNIRHNEFNDDQDKNTRSRKVAFNKPEVIDKNNSSNSNGKNHDLTIQKAVAVIEELSKYQSADPEKLEHYINKIKSNSHLAKKEYNRLSPKLEEFKKQSNNNNNNTNDGNNESNYITFNLMDLNGKTHKKKIDIQSNPEMVYYHNTVAKQVSNQNSPFGHLQWNKKNNYSDQNNKNHDYNDSNKKKQGIRP